MSFRTLPAVPTQSGTVSVERSLRTVRSSTGAPLLIPAWVLKDGEVLSKVRRRSWRSQRALDSYCDREAQRLGRRSAHFATTHRGSWAFDTDFIVQRKDRRVAKARKAAYA